MNDRANKPQENSQAPDLRQSGAFETLRAVRTRLFKALHAQNKVIDELRSVESRLYRRRDEIRGLITDIELVLARLTRMEEGASLSEIFRGLDRLVSTCVTTEQEALAPVPTLMREIAGQAERFIKASRETSVQVLPVETAPEPEPAVPSAPEPKPAKDRESDTAGVAAPLLEERPHPQAPPTSPTLPPTERVSERPVIRPSPPEPEAVPRKTPDSPVFRGWFDDVDELLAARFARQPDGGRMADALSVLKAKIDLADRIVTSIPGGSTLAFGGYKLQWALDLLHRLYLWMEEGKSGRGIEDCRRKIAEEWVGSIFPVFYRALPDALREGPVPDKSSLEGSVVILVFDHIPRVVRTVIQAALGLNLVSPSPGSPIPRDQKLEILSRSQTADPYRANTVKTVHRPGLRGPGVAIPPQVDILLGM